MTFITETIAIGNCVDAEDQAALQAAGIRSILCLNGQLAGRTPEHCGVEALACFSFIDGAGNDPGLFGRAVRLVGQYATQNPKLLVHCQAGRSRSVMVVAVYLARQNGWELRKALDFIHARRREILHPAALLSLWDINDEGGIG
jgi:protein tyrosine phosphatase (PTP) superfamily phosphohydrolase (DUF442 family)